MNILIAGRGDFMRRSVRTMLRLLQYGRKIQETGNGGEAWKFLQNRKVDLIIADYTLPGMNGIELLRRVRGDRKLRDTLFLIITAEANREVVAEAAEYDVDGYLALPFDSATLAKTIDTIFSKAVSPEPMIVHLRTARDLKEEGKLAEAIKETEKAAAAKPDSSRPLREQGKLYMESGDKEKAISCFQKSIALNQLDITSHYNLGKLFVEEDKVDQAVQHFSRALEINPRGHEWAFDFASLLLEKNEKEEAGKIFTSILKRNPDDIDLLVETGKTAARHNLESLAIKCFQTVIKKQPQNTYTHKMLGILLQRNKKNKEAVNHLEKAVADYGEDLGVLLSLARAYFDMDRIVRADKWATTASRLYPDNLEIKKLLRSL